MVLQQWGAGTLVNNSSCFRQKPHSSGYEKRRTQNSMEDVIGRKLLNPFLQLALWKRRNSGTGLWGGGNSGPQTTVRCIRYHTPSRPKLDYSKHTKIKSHVFGKLFDKAVPTPPLWMSSLLFYWREIELSKSVQGVRYLTQPTSPLAVRGEEAHKPPSNLKH